MTMHPSRSAKSRRGGGRGSGGAGGGYLGGQLLIAMPSIRDPHFARTVVYMCTHSSDGAMGLVINRSADDITFPDLMVQARILDEGQEKTIVPAARNMRVHIGGPVEKGRGFVLHTNEFRGNDSTVAVDDAISLTATIDVLKAIARGRGPARALLALGCAGWGAGQLEREMQANGWLHCPASLDLVFDGDIEGKYARALGCLGVNPSHLVSEAGHA